mgnify:FL=1
MTKPRFTDDDVYDILTSPQSNGVVAKRYNCCRSYIALIRAGKALATLAPDIERWGPSRSCHACIHWVHSENARCDLGFPDPLEPGIGVSFARECNTYKEAIP